MTAISNLVQQRSDSTGAGDFTLSPVGGRRSFYSAFGPGGSDVFFYFITHSTAAEWEVGTGHLADAVTLVRDTVISSSAGGTEKVDFTPGRKDVVNDLPASYQSQLLTLSSSYMAAGAPIDGQVVGGVVPAAGTFTTLTTTVDMLNTVNNGTVSSVEGLSAVEHGTPYHHYTAFSLDSVAVNVTHGGGSDGYGNLKIYSFPVRALTRLGTRIALTGVGSSGGVNANAAFQLAFGHTAQTSANGGSLVSNADSFSPSGGVAVTLSGGEAGAVTGNSNLNTGTLDGVGTARSLYINLAGVDTTADGTVTLSGSVFVSWASF